MEAHIRRAAWREALTPARPQAGRGWVLAGPSGVVADRVELATSPLTRAKGLLGRRSIDRGSALLIAPCSEVHTVGMRFPIDVVFCDADLRVLAVDTLPPGKLMRRARGARCCFELPAGAAAASGIVPGVVLRFEPQA